MGIGKQEFYEGAALHLLARSGRITSIQYKAPFFLLNRQLLVHLKYSTRVRSPWGFTFTPEELVLLEERAFSQRTVIALVCGSDGVAAFGYEDLLQIAETKKSAVHIACHRQHGEHYAVSGPDGRLDGKVAPSNWRRILEQ